MIGLERETWMLVAANIALGVLVLICVAAVACGLIYEILRRARLHPREAGTAADVARRNAEPGWHRPMRPRLLKGKPY